MALTIVARITAAEGRAEFVRSELEKLIGTTRAERGCLQYDLHIDTTRPDVFLFYETWESRELWQAHMAAPHLQAYMQATEGAVADFTLHEMTKIA
ncbi:MAG: putative quinol monooxygenase [Pseudomonadota bacterium]